MTNPAASAPTIPLPGRVEPGALEVKAGLEPVELPVVAATLAEVPVVVIVPVGMGNLVSDDVEVVAGV